MLNAKKTVSLTIVFLMVLLAFASSIDFVKATTYQYPFQGPFYLNGDFATGNTVVCNLLWANYTTTQLTLTLGQILYSPVQLLQVTWNASSALNYTSLIDLKPLTNGVVTQYVNIFIPNPAYPSSKYTFSVTDFFGMSNAYLQLNINNASTGATSMAEQFNLNNAGTPTFTLTEYLTYTLTFICDQGTYSQQFTAESTLANTLVVLSGMFPTANVTSPTATVTRINDTLIGITYVDPSNSTSSGSVLITHQSGMVTINDYYTTAIGNSTSILWNAALQGVSYDVNVTGVIGGVSYIWVLVAPETISTNPFLGAFDWLGQNTQTMPHVQTGWPAGMTSAQIGEIIGAAIVMLFLCIGSFRSAGACCMLSWIIFGVLLYLGWMGTVTPYTIPEFAFSGFLGILIMIDESKQTAREV